MGLSWIVLLLPLYVIFNAIPGLAQRMLRCRKRIFSQ
jgi:hypothetical protein